MTKKKSKHGNLLFILPILGLTVGGLLLFFLPNFREIRKQRELLQMRRDFIAQSDSLSKEIAQLEGELKKTNSYCDKWRDAAPQDDQVPLVHADINERVDKAGAAVTRFDPLPTVEMESIRQVPLSLGASGTFDQLFALLVSLEAMPQTTWLENLRLAAGGKDGNTMRCEVNLVTFGEKSEDSD